MKKGNYIILEGGEGCGKDYQAELLVPWLESKGLEVVLTKEPGGTKEADKIREILLDEKNTLSPLTELFLYQAARKDLNDKVIIPSLNKNKFVLSKRGFPSTYAYQGFAGDLELEIVKRENKLAMSNILPDFVFIIDVNPKVGLKKEKNPDRFAKKGIQYHKKVREGYLDFAKEYPDISIVLPYLEDNPQKIQQKIRECIETSLLQ